MLKPKCFLNITNNTIEISLPSSNTTNSNNNNFNYQSDNIHSIQSKSDNNIIQSNNSNKINDAQDDNPNDISDSNAHITKEDTIIDDPHDSKLRSESMELRYSLDLHALPVKYAVANEFLHKGRISSETHVQILETQHNIDYANSFPTS